MQKIRSNATIALIAFTLVAIMALGAITPAGAQFVNQIYRGSFYPNPRPVSHPVFGDTNGQGGHPLASEPNERSYWNPVPLWQQYASYTGAEPQPSPWWGVTNSGQPRYNQSNNSYNPWSTFPQTSHIRWLDQYNFGGVLVTQQQWGSGIRPSGRTQYGSDAYAAVAYGGFMVMGIAETTPILRCMDEWSGNIVWETCIPGGSTVPMWIRYSGSNPIVEVKAGTTLGVGNTFCAYHLRDGTFAGNTTFPISITFYFNHTKYGEMYGQGDDVAIGSDNLNLFCYSWPGFDTGTERPVKLWGPVYCGGGVTGIIMDDNYMPVIISANLQRGYLSAVDALTGKFLWDAAITGNMENSGGGYGRWYQPMGDGSIWAYNARTGHIDWVNRNATGSYWVEFHVMVGDHCVACANKDGNIYCFDSETGDLKWTFFAGACPYEPWKSDWGVYAYHENCIGGGLEGSGKTALFEEVGDEGTAAYSSYPGSYGYAIDLQTGELMWKYPSVAHTHPPDPSVFDGLMYFPDSVTYQSILMGKGPTKIDLSVTASQITSGASTWITGRITDQSPGQPDTPCVSKDSMDAWMAYIHGGYAKPPAGIIKGVPLSLVAIDQNNNIIDLGNVTSNADGYFKLKFTPPSGGNFYVIAASFSEDDSYYSTYQVTNLAVEPLASAATATGSVIAPNTTMSTVTLAAIVVVGLIGAVNVAVLLKTRKHKGGNQK